MKVQPKQTTIKKFLMGGPVEGAPSEETPVEGGAPTEGAEQDPMMMLFQMAAQALLAQDCQAMAQVCQALLEIGQQMQGGGAPEEAPGQPVFRKGGILVRRIKK